MSKIETLYIYDAGERIYLPLSNGGISPLRGTHGYIYMSPRALRLGGVIAQKNHQIEIALSSGEFSLRERVIPEDIYMLPSLSPGGSGGAIFSRLPGPLPLGMVLPRNIDSSGAHILRTVVLRGAPRTPSKVLLWLVSQRTQRACKEGLRRSDN